MHPNEEPADPTAARTDAEFVAALRVLVQWSRLPLEEIEHRIVAYGGHPDEGAVLDALEGDTLPSEELLVALLWAVGCDEDTVDLWLWAHSRLAAASARFDPAEVDWVPQETNTFSGGSLAHAIEERSDKGGWRGLHRPAVPAGGEAKHAMRQPSPHRLRIVIAAVVAGVIALGAGVAIAFSGTGSTPPAERRADPPCCVASPGQWMTAPASADVPAATPTPATSIKPVVSPSRKPTPTTAAPRPTPTQTQAPKLTGSASTPCAAAGGKWVVTVTITANLTGAPSGTDPLGRANQDPWFPLNGSGGTTYSGPPQPIEVGPDTSPLSGTIQWSAKVNVPGGGPPAETGGSEGFNCA